MIEARNLTKLYGKFVALNDLSFSVERGEVLGFLGPNGAGKSTTLRILAGFIGATSGDVKINGFSVTDQSIEARASIGYMPESSPLYPEMRVREYLSYRAELKRVPRAKRQAAVDSALEDAGLTDVDGVLIAQLSKGFRQRVGLADALVASPPLLILDEPTAGLDPNQIRDVRALIKRLRDKHTIVVSTHILSEVEAMCTRGIMIAAGELVAQGSLDELRALRRPLALKLRIRGEAAVAKKILEQVPGAGTVALESQPSEAAPRFSVDFADPADSDAITERIAHALHDAGLSVLELVPSSSLEQVFADLTTKKRRASADAVRGKRPAAGALPDWAPAGATPKELSKTLSEPAWKEHLASGREIERARYGQYTVIAIAPASSPRVMKYRYRLFLLPSDGDAPVLAVNHEASALGTMALGVHRGTLHRNYDALEEELSYEEFRERARAILAEELLGVRAPEVRP